MNESRFLTISAINKYLALKFETDYTLNEVYLQGEISNFKFSGKHCYFSLKDSSSEISAMFFYPDNISLNFEVKDGMSVQVVGKIQVYQKKGTYAIIVKKMVQTGIGLLYQEYIELKDKLQKEGLFDESKKLPIPQYPEVVAVITASNGEAIHDIISTFNRRFPLAKIKLYPALVQGRDAPKDLVRALDLVYKDNDADAIIIGRGGGSFEDLSCFNDEQLARKLFESTIPTISAVGHEGDYTICDFVASFRAPTPTGAAMKLSKDRTDVNDILVNNSKRLSSSIKNVLTLNHQKWKSLNDSYALAGFPKYLDSLAEKLTLFNERLSLLTPSKIAERLDENLLHLQKRLISTINKDFEALEKSFLNLSNRIKEDLIINKADSLLVSLEHFESRCDNSFDLIVKSNERKLDSFNDKLVLLNPLNIMKKGYSIVRKDGIIISSIKEIKTGNNINIKLQDGSFDAIVNKIIERENKI